jgi:hypothetical protein
MPSNWTQRVRPGIEIQMSISMQTRRVSSRGCPRWPRCDSYIRRVSKWEICCLACGFSIFVEHENQVVEMPPASVTAPKPISSIDECFVSFTNNIESQTPAPEHRTKSSTSILTNIELSSDYSDLLTEQEKQIDNYCNEIREIKVLKRVHLDLKDVHLGDDQSQGEARTGRKYVKRSIRKRIPFSCHHCSTNFGAGWECSQCKHRLCNSCPRDRPRETTSE